MKKKLTALILAMAFVVSTAGVSTASRYVKCEVKSVEGSNVVLDCGDDAGDLDVGSKVKVKKSRRGGGIEGC